MNILYHTGGICYRHVGHLLVSKALTSASSLSNGRPLSTSQWQKYLTILNVDKHATTAEIKNSFLKLSKVYHPDNSVTGSHAKFVELKAAYDALKNGHPTITPPPSQAYHKSFYESDISHETQRQYRERYRDFTANHEYGFGGPYRRSKNPWEDLQRDREYRRKKDYAENFGQRGRPIVSLTIILSAVAWIVIYSSALLIWDYNDKIKNGTARFKSIDRNNYVAYQEYLKKKETERLSNLNQLRKLAEDQRKGKIEEDDGETVKTL